MSKHLARHNCKKHILQWPLNEDNLVILGLKDLFYKQLSFNKCNGFIIFQLQDGTGGRTGKLEGSAKTHHKTGTIKKPKLLLQ